MTTTSHDNTVDQAVKTARQHLPIEREVSAKPCGFAILDEGNHYGVYGRNSYDTPRRLLHNGFLPPGPDLKRFALVGYVNLDGSFTKAA